MCHFSMISSFFEYDLQKSGRGAHFRIDNKQKFLMRVSGEHKSLIKVCEPDFEENELDFKANVIYSMNKDKRCKIAENLDENLNPKILVIERQFDGFFWSQWTRRVHRSEEHFRRSKIKNRKEIEGLDIDGNYEDLIVYTLFSSPKLNTTRYKNESLQPCSCCYLKHEPEYERFDGRKALEKFYKEEIMELVDDNYEDIGSEKERNRNREEFYNLEEHLIRKPGYDQKTTDRILEILKNKAKVVKDGVGSDDRDFVDRLHSYFTCNLLIGLAVLVSFKQFGGKPVECLVPDIFSSSWEQYAENYCWASDTYFVPIGDPVAGIDTDEKRQRKISYYQWVPFFLLLEAACFRLPSLLWKYLAGHSGIKINEIVKLSSDPNNIKPDIKRANIKSLTVHLQGALRFHRRLQKKQIRPHRFLCFFNLPYSAFFVTAMYLCTKFLYLGNVCLQLAFMNKFLETDKYKWYGLGAVVDLLNGTTWEQSGMFPRVSLCDFDVRVMGNLQEHTIQCVLVINIFNEKIFILLWFWYLALLVFTFGSFSYWLIVSLWSNLNRRFIIRHLEMSDIAFDSTDEGAEDQVKKFIDNYLKSDGVFVIRMMTLQSGVIFGTDLIQELWRNFYGSEQQLKRSNSLPKMEGGGGAPRNMDEQWWPAPPPLVNQITPSRYRNDNETNALRWRRALGANIDNTIATQDLMEKLLPRGGVDSRGGTFSGHQQHDQDELLRLSVAAFAPEIHDNR
ncbi:unnamed protein product [Caenorhabditis angaria]|uniref:Innexin n=1 Tax=Caenorhabditis angaria TaxID=860376 RepID=A0A9P1IU75_9PELO|nr:unnamed protein product [Caenorhabditis angaria]